MNQTWENGKKPLGPNLGLKKIFFVGFTSTRCLTLSQTNCRKLPLHANSRKMYDPNSRKWETTSFSAWLRTLGPRFGLPFHHPTLPPYYWSESLKWKNSCIKKKKICFVKVSLQINHIVTFRKFWIWITSHFLASIIIKSKTKITTHHS